jgi:uncharacterized membrane-anchored protein
VTTPDRAPSVAAADAPHLVPPDHPLRFELNDEVHARPPESLQTPLRLSYLGMFAPWSDRELEWQRLCELAERFGVTPPPRGVSHFSANYGPFRLKWERHSEFARYVFIVPGVPDDYFATPALEVAPRDWVANLPGKVIVAAHAALVRAPDEALDYDALATQYFDGNALVGGKIGAGLATALTDFRIRTDGFSRLLVFDRGLTPRQAGRMVQRLFEIDSYRMLALLALPIARAHAPDVTRWERELAEITNALPNADEQSEPVLLDRLTRLEAQTESRKAENHFRFSAAEAYYDLVKRRIAELREDRIQGLPTFEEFTERRLAPAMSTCTSLAKRQDSLSQRVSQATQLLSTRVDITRERQNQRLLESMDQRSALQLRLQSTVEGLSVAAVTYYVVGLVNYAAKAFEPPVSAALVTAISIPIVALMVALAVRRIRRLVKARMPH